MDILQKVLRVSFKDVTLLEQALVHSSYVNENPGLTPTSNERLEFLGDAILGFVVAEKLYHDPTDFTEGQMTKLRAGLVQRDTLVRMARAVSLGEYLYLGKGEEASGGRDKPANLAGTMEAVIAAIFLDRGLPFTRDFVLGMIDKELDKVVKQGTAIDYKSELQERLQARHQPTPTYHVIETTGPDHDRIFTVEVRVGETVLGRSSGKSKKTAESEAARAALEKLP